MADPEYGIIYSFDGTRLSPQQSVDRLYKAGFTDVQQLAIGYAVMMGESGRYLRAWHNNVDRNPDGSIALDENGEMTVRSTDLGYVQRNVRHNPAVHLLPQEGVVRPFIDSLFAAHPELGRADESAKIARGLYVAAGNNWTPWFAFTNRSYKKSLPSACLAVAKYLQAVFLGIGWR